MPVSRAAVAFIGLALFAASCGGGSGETTALVATEKNTAPPAAQGPALPDAQEAPLVATASDLPAIELINVVSGEQTNLASLVPSDRPLLLWFWAPH